MISSTTMETVKESAVVQPKKSFSCPNCVNFVRFAPLFHKYNKAFLQCPRCDFIFQGPTPSSEELARIYSKEYYEAWNLSSSPEMVRQQKLLTFKNWFGVFLRSAPTVKVSSSVRHLDVGCATGLMLEYAQSLGLDTYGVELSDYSAQIAKSRFGEDRIHLGPIGTSPFQAGSFDVVTMFDLIEHDPDLETLLSKVHQLLKMDGHVVLTTPNTRSISRAILGKHWTNFLPEHIYYFNPKNIEDLLSRAGFETITVRPAKKCLTLDYISAWFGRNRKPFLTPALKFLTSILPKKVLATPMTYVFGDMIVVAKKVVAEPKPEIKKVSIIIPAYNEERTLSECVSRVVNADLGAFSREVIVVESNSKDGTRGLLRDLEARYPLKCIYQDAAKGKGNAVREGMRHATGEIILIQDADLEYSVSDYLSLIQPIVSGKAKFVLGSRVLGKEKWKIRQFNDGVFTSFLYNSGGWLINAFFNLLYGTRLTDQATMFKVFSKAAADRIEFKGDTWDFDVEVIAKFVRQGVVPLEIPVHYDSRNHAEGKKMRFIDAFTVLKAMVKYRILN